MQSIGKGAAGEGDEAVLELKREGQVDLLTDNRPEEAVENRGCLHETQFRSADEEAVEPELAGEAGEGGGVLVESE